jgi:hypothetical protein
VRERERERERGKLIDKLLHSEDVQSLDLTEV